MAKHSVAANRLLVVVVVVVVAEGEDVTQIGGTGWDSHHEVLGVICNHQGMPRRHVPRLIIQSTVQMQNSEATLPRVRTLTAVV